MLSENLVIEICTKTLVNINYNVLAVDYFQNIEIETKFMKLTKKLSPLVENVSF